MTVEKAIEAMKFYKEKLYNGIFNQFIAAFDIAVSALEKQIPKKVCEVQKDYIIKHHCCPSCDYPVAVSFIKDRIADFKKDKYCNNCGQALEWRDIK